MRAATFAARAVGRADGLAGRPDRSDEYVGGAGGTYRTAYAHGRRERAEAQAGSAGWEDALAGRRMDTMQFCMAHERRAYVDAFHETRLVMNMESTRYAMAAGE